MKSRSFIYISLLVDVIIAASKFIAAYLTHSSSMASEGIHSVIDAVTQVLLIWGLVQSRQQPDEIRPFGYGRELYFWSFVVSLSIFLLGGCISVYEGISQLSHPHAASSPELSGIILAVALVFTSVSMVSALRAFNKQRGSTSFWKAITTSKDPTVFIVLLGDIADIAGLLVASAGIVVSRLSGNILYDAIAASIIGGIMLAVSLLLIRESKSLLMGETINRSTIKRILSIAEADDTIIRIKKHYSTYMAPDEAILQLNAVFKKDLTTVDITDAISRIISNIQQEYPGIRQIFIEPIKP